MAKVKSNKLEIGVCCKTQKEQAIMLTLLVYIQNCYNLKFKKEKSINLRQLVDCALRNLDKIDSAHYPFPEKEEK